MAMNVIIDNANDRKGSKINTTMSFVLDFNHRYQQKPKKTSAVLPLCPQLYSRERKSLAVDFRPAKNRGGSPAWATMFEVKEETFCGCT